MRKRFLPTTVALLLLSPFFILGARIADRYNDATSNLAPSADVTVITAPQPPTTVATRATAPTTAAPGLPTLVTTPVGMCPQEDSCRIDYRSDGRWYIYPAAH